MHIVVFPGWYPSKFDQLSGDFIQRHMQAIALHCRITVIIPVKDSTINKGKTVVVELGNLTEVYHYYPSVSSLKWLDRLLSFFRYNYLCVTEVKRLSKKEKIDLVYLYVLQKNHLLGILVKRLYNIRYVISECSTFYIDGSFDKVSWFRKQFLKYVFKRSASVHAVSKYLASALKNKLQLNEGPVVIANVVDASVFYYDTDGINDRVTFVHVSNMSHQKNVEGMLQAFADVKKVQPNFVLNLVGPLSSSVSSIIHKLDLSKQVVVWNERSYGEVAAIMQRSDVFVFFTRHETFGCVIIEANACGLPLIVTDLDVTRELVSEEFNGLFVQNENIADLTEKILFMINHHQQFDPLAISLQTRNTFNYEKVGKQFLEWFVAASQQV